MAIALFCNEVKGKSMLALCRELDVQYKTAFVLAHKLREAMASSTKALRIGGDRQVAEIDGAYFGGHIRPENLTIERIDRRLAENRSGKRQVVAPMRERGGRTLAQVFPAEADAVAAIRLRIAKRACKPVGFLCQEDARASCCARDEGGPFGAVL